MIELDIATGSYESDSLPLAAQRCINLFPNYPQADAPALSERALFSTPGITLSDTAGGINRGSCLMGGIPYLVQGTSLCSLDSGLNLTVLGTITGTTRVSMATNGTKLVIVVPGETAYVYEAATGNLSSITDVDFILSDTVVYKDGYFVFTASNGSVFFNSGLNDPENFSALDFGTAEINPDKIVAAHVNHNELFILGEETVELFQNIGGAGFPFQRIPGANIQKGCHAKHSVVEFDNTFLFAGGGKDEKTAIWKVTGSSSAVKISTSAVDRVIQGYTKAQISTIFAHTYAQDGNFFAVFTFPDRTFVYEATASAHIGRPVWHERQTGVTNAKWRVNSIITAYGKHIVGDNVDGRVGYLDKSVFTEYGNTIFRQKTTLPVPSDFWGDLELTMEAGVGDVDDPEVRLDWSDDGGRTWGSELFRGFGKVGEYFRRVIWRRLGDTPKYRVLRFTVTDPVKVVMIKLEAT